MISVFTNSWALLFGMMLLMVGNGLHGTLLGVRGEIEQFTTFQMSIVMSAYFVGFLGASRMAPEMIRRVGHVRVFAALASFISAVLVLFPLIANPWIWAVGRLIIGFCFCGVYVTAESWLNNAATNENRGQSLSLYMIIQMLGLVVGQGLLILADPGGYVLFIVISILVSLSFAPILLSITPTPAFETTNPMQLKKLVLTSPLGCVGMFLLGGVFSVQFGMASVFGAEISLSLAEISAFAAAFYIGAMLVQYPVGWMSDRMDRRQLIMGLSVLGTGGALLAIIAGSNFIALLLSAFLIGGMSNPLYSLLIAHTNDYLDFDDMASASGGLLFINGVGAISGPLIVGWVMQSYGPFGYFLIIALLLGTLALYAAYRTTRRAAPSVEDANSYTPVLPTASPVALELAQEFAIETAQEDENIQNTD
ncbi:MAG: MFS transporter [Paracoccaceae bacterium]|nr:MFS transporter [Paracoccaceae bacterium]